MHSENRVLAIDDDSTNLAIIQEALDGKCELRTATDAQSALKIARNFRPRVVLLDIMMPHVDGYEICRLLREDPIARHCRIILVSAKTEVCDRVKGYRSGADDYLIKPFDDDELNAKVGVALSTKSVDEFATVREQVRTCGLHGQTLAIISQFRDAEDGSHLVNVRGIAHILAAQLREGPYEAQIDDEFLDNLYTASVLHDVGKVAIPDDILRQHEDRTAEECEQMKEHTIAGERILKHLARQHSKAGVYQMSADVARWHHECFDGSGYPDGLRGQVIPLAARIVKVADGFDTSLRNLGSQHSEDLISVRNNISNAAGTEFDPSIVAALLTSFDEIRDLYVDDMFVETLELTT
jgi:putative two-component system response regulator